MTKFIHVHQVKAIKYQEGVCSKVVDTLTVEEMLQISINSEPYTTTMRTPGFEEELSRGILLTEKVYSQKANPVFNIIEKNQQGFVTKVNLDIDPQSLESGILTKRNLMSVTSCGMCGQVESHLIEYESPIISDTVLKASEIFSMFTKMRSHQENFDHSGGSHASAAFNGIHLLDVKEDIGRHNALDKVIGSLLLQNKLSEANCLLVSGRISYEIVSKCYRAGIPFLAAVSAPSSMAVNYCNQLGITLLAFCRENKLTAYAHPERLIMA